MIRHPAWLILGPTGAGKSPLGDAIERDGLGDARRWFHFDFGENLRGIDAGRLPHDGLSAADQAVITQALHGGALLENENFPIAERILQSFCRRRGLGPTDGLIMNGLPRHAGQARDVDRCVDIRGVLLLDCPAAVVRDRIRRNSGGDRTHRVDDDPAAVERKLQLFADRTLPLLDHYRAKGVSVFAFPVAVETTAAEVRRAMPRLAGD